MLNKKENIAEKEQLFGIETDPFNKQSRFLDELETHFVISTFFKIILDFCSRKVLFENQSSCWTNGY